ncbi:S24 family peptidase [Vibrio agarivorans]|uniref:S24 family peptidase n=1 Tax=Vibrio agarivorans TaxID=153622 RepID=UPI0025B42675|nr:S24 family peptidase [Vibrio agarivorans]MDN3661152.1 S24 family peptidase [Vibrio agarivorans]
MATVNKFESPANEYASLSELNLHTLLVGNHHHSIFFSYAQGNNLRSRGIMSGDLIIADRAVKPHDGDLVIALAVDGFVLRVIDLNHRCLRCDNEPSIPLHGDVIIEATVTQTIRCHRPLQLN